MQKIKLKISRFCSRSDFLHLLSHRKEGNSMITNGLTYIAILMFVAGGLLMKSVGSMGQEKVETNPLVAQLPKYNDTANKTLGVMLDIIQKLGTAAPVGEKLGEFLNG